MLRMNRLVDLMPELFGSTTVQFVCIGIFAFLKYRCNFALGQYFIHQAQLSLAERLHLDQNLKLSRTLLHSAVLYSIFHSTTVSSFFFYIIFKNAPIVREFQVEFASLFAVTVALLIGVTHPIIFIKEIPLLRKQLLRKVLTNLVNSSEQLRKNEGDLRFEHLTDIWNSAYENKT